MSEAVLFEKKDGVATVTLNRPDRLNAVNDEIRAGLKEKLDDACKDDEVKVIIITGAGRGFCAGADMDGLAATSEGKSQGGQREAAARQRDLDRILGQLHCQHRDDRHVPRGPRGERPWKPLRHPKHHGLEGQRRADAGGAGGRHSHSHWDGRGVSLQQPEGRQVT